MDRLVLLTGASGYIGGRLLPALEARNLRVRCLARRPQQLAGRVGPRTEVVGGDVLDVYSLMTAMGGVDTAYYLVPETGSEEEDHGAARSFARAAVSADVRRIVYLSCLGSPEARREEIGTILRRSGVQTIELAASVVIGSGSRLFETVRALVDRLPAMLTPRWVFVPAQPIAVDDLLRYLLGALDIEVPHNAVYEIGGADVASCADVMHAYACERGLTRRRFAVPLTMPRLSSRWLALVTPLYVRAARKLVDGLRRPSVLRHDSAARAFDLRPLGVREAVAAALRHEGGEVVPSRWSDALSASPPARDWSGRRFRERRVDSRVAHVAVPPATAFATVERIGGATGWYYADWLWRARGFVDALAGGVGMRRGRRDPDHLHPGDTVDCWRVDAIEPGCFLRLVAEMRLPGRAWLEFEVTPEGRGAFIRQTATFEPVGLLGLAYWYGGLPIHRRVCAGQLRNLAQAAGYRRATPVRESRAS